MTPLGRSDDWDDGTVNHAASAEWNAGVRPDKEQSSMPSWIERTATGHRVRIGGTVGADDQRIGYDELDPFEPDFEAPLRGPSEP